MCLICMKYRIIILIIIIISLGKISLSYIAKTSRTHAHTRSRTRTSPPTTVAVRCIGAPNQSVMVGRIAFDAGETMASRCSLRTTTDLRQILVDTDKNETCTYGKNITRNENILIPVNDG